MIRARFVFKGSSNNRRRQVVVDIVEVHDIGLKGIEQPGHTLAVFDRINRPTDIPYAIKPLRTSELHCRGINIPFVTDEFVRVVHTEILDIVSCTLQEIAQTKKVGLHASATHKELAHLKNLHRALPL